MLTKLTALLVALTGSGVATAQYAVAPDAAHWGEPGPAVLEETLLRARVGPALRVAHDSTTAGLGTALEAGRRSGLRIAAIWTAVGETAGAEQYGADLWLSFAGTARWRPTLAAGAALIRTPDENSSSAEDTESFGAATVRGSADYLLGTRHADARLGVEAMGVIPAIDAGDRRPWGVFLAHLSLGF